MINKSLTNNLKDSGILRILFISIFSVTGLTIMIVNYGYIGVLTTPDYAQLTQKVVFEKNETNQNITEVNIYLKDLRSLLLGGEAFAFHLETEQGNYFFLVQDAAIKKGGLIPLQNAEFSVKDKFFPGTHRDCLSMPETGIVNGHLNVTKYKQGFKSFVLEGEIVIENAEFKTKTGCYVKGEYVNEVVSAKLDQTTIAIKANSSVIYEWSGKGGDTYRL